MLFVPSSIGIAVVSETMQVAHVSLWLHPDTVWQGGVAGFLREVYGRDLTHRVENEVVGEKPVAFNEACEYPDGTRVLCAATLELRDGKIVRQIGVQAWDK